MSDKITTLLEQQLKTLGQKVRLDILKDLYGAERPLAFSELQRRLSLDPSVINLTYHLKNLKEVNLIETPSKKYRITQMGTEILQKVLAIEDILNERDKQRMIRTSRYSTEFFDLNNITDYLVRESDMNPLLAEKISKLVRKKLSHTNIKYLTTPLIREFINGVLIQEGFEEYRHKLTRLGVPPYDTLKMFNNSSTHPNSFITRLGAEASEQFLLLNLLPRDLADLYLSKKLVLLHLETWALKPLSCFLNTGELLKSIIEESHGTETKKNHTSYPSLSRNILEFIRVLNNLGSYVSNDLLLYNFDDIFPLIDCKRDSFTFVLNLLHSHLSLLHKTIQPCVDLAFNFGQNSNLSQQFIRNIITPLKNQLMVSPQCWCPQLFLDYSGLESVDDVLNFFNFSFDKYPEELIFYKDNANLLNRAFISPFRGDFESWGSFILDKIFINLYDIALEADQNDDAFLSILERRLNATFQIFSYKEHFLEKRFKNLANWNRFIEKYFDINSNTWIRDSLKSISFIGLNEAVKVHCGLELDRIKESEDFAIRIVKFMKRLISEKNQISNTNFCLTQPHNGKYLKHFKPKRQFNMSNQLKGVSYKLIRESSNLSLENHILLFKKFNSILDGGGLLGFLIDHSHAQDKRQIIETFFKHNPSAFQIKRNRDRV